MSATVDGIVTGLDTTAIVEASVALAAVPKYQMEDQIDEAEDRLQKVAGLMNRLEDLSESIGDMDTESELVSMTSTLTDDSQFAVSTDSDAVPGTYDILVNRLASAETETSQGFADSTSTGIIDEGTYTVDYAGEITDITIDSSNSSLTDLAASIDEIDGLTSYVLDTGDGSGSPYVLVIQGEDSGSDNTISVTTSGMAGTATEPTFTEQVSAQDSWITVNNVDVYDADNRISSLPGITLDLEATGTTAATLTVERDDSSIEEKVQAFVDAYNEMATYYDTHTSYNAEEEIKGALVGDSVARRAVDRMGTLVSSPYTVTDSTLETLSQLGVETQSDGTLEFNTEELSDALEDDFDNVVTFLTDADGPLATVKDTIDALLVDEDNGTLTSRQESLQDQIDELEARVADYDVYLEEMSDRIRGRFTELEVVMGTLQSTQSYLTALFSS